MMVEVKMDNQKGMNIAVWTEKSEQLLNKTKDLFNQISLDSDVLPASVYEHEKPITIVFVGQFSAGKSTIIKALTGIEDIEIGAGIKTQETQFYKWKDLELVDTPGIGTELRPDHDEITYDAIAKADMLVYVVTSELFEDVTGQNFRKILLENDKAGEMILIVNKMATTGNTDEKRRIKLKDLEKVTEPYSPEQLRTVFIDAKSYIESKTIDDPDISEVYRERSNYDELVETINKFVKEKGYSSRLTTVLYTLFKVLQDAVEKYQPSTGDTDIDAIEEHSLHERNIVAQTMWRIESSVKSIYEASASEIREKGRNVANEIYECTDEEEANNLIEVAYNAVDEIADKCVDDVTAKIEELADDCQAKLDDFYQSDFSQTLQFRLNGKKEKNNPIINKFLSSDLIAQGSNKLIDATAGSDAAANGLKAFSGSNAHEMVLNIGHYFGHSFKPWEAVKWVKKINVAGKALGVFGVVLSLGMQAKSDIDEEKRNTEMRRNREQLRAGFNDAANELRTHFNTALNGLINENYQTRLDEIDNHVAEIRALRIDKSETYKKLAQIQDECRLLIADIHKDSEDNSEKNSNKESKN